MLSHKSKSRVKQVSVPADVSSLPIPPERWVKALNTIKGPQTINVNRLRFKKIPLKVTRKSINAGRDELILRFWQSLTTLPMSDNSCYAYFIKAKKFLNFADESNINFHTHQCIELWIQHQHIRVLNGLITEAYASQEIAAFRKFISLCGLSPIEIFPQHNPFSERARGNKDIRTLPYTKNEERQLLIAINSLYRQLMTYVLKKSEEPFAKIVFKGKKYDLPCHTNSWPKHPANYWQVFVVCAFYKLTAYLGYNTSTLTNLKLSQIQKLATSNGHFYRLNPVKGRQGGMVDSKEISTPKMISFFDEYLSLLPNISSSECDWVFPIFNSKKLCFTPLYDCHVTVRINKTIRRIYNPVSENGSPLRLGASRFRKNRNLIAHYVAGPIAAARDASHSVRTEDRFYGTIHPHDGMKQTASATAVLTQLGKLKIDIKDAKASVAKMWNIDLLPLEEAYRQYGQIKQMPNGVRCKNGFEGENPKKYQIIIEQLGNNLDRVLPCALYESCLSCSQSVVIDCEEDAYLLLSFREYIANSVSFHVDGNHLEINYGELLSKIDITILLFSDRFIQSAKMQIFEKGLHPFWNRFVNG